MLNFEDVISLLGVNSDNYDSVIDNCINKFLEEREGSKREVYRTPLSEKESLSITVSDPMEVLDKKVSDIVILDIALKYQIENNEVSSPSQQSKPFNFDSLKSVTSGNEILSKIKGLGNLESQDILNFKSLYTLKGFAIKNEIPVVTVSASVSNKPGSKLGSFFKDLGARDSMVSNLPEKVFSININIGISNVRSKFMR